MGGGVDTTPEVGFVPCTPPRFEAGDLIFAKAALLFKPFGKFSEDFKGLRPLVREI